MRAGSLRLRLIIGGIVAILIALTVAGGGLVFLFKRHVVRSMGDDLNVYLNQLIAGIDVDAQGRLLVTRPLADPRFSEPLSGFYWQIADDRGQMLRSRSLWDTELTLEPDQPAPGQIHLHEMAGPVLSHILVAERVVTLTLAKQRESVRIAVATDLERVSKAAGGYVRDLTIALGLLGVVLTVATGIQVSIGLQPLQVLRQGIADVRAGRSDQLPSAVPTEVKPLVEEVNGLLDAQEREIERSRGRAADLAHGLKTPLAALTGDARRLRAVGQDAIACDIESAAQAMSRFVDRELVRARSRGAIRRKASLSTPLAPLMRSLIATLVRTPAGARVTFEQNIPESVSVPMDRTDLAEVLGNLLDNAAQHATKRVCVSAGSMAAGATVVIEDDGKGIEVPALSSVLQRGIRLDESDQGAGLGLAIAQDVLNTYSWRLTLNKSPHLGGFQVTLMPGEINASTGLTVC